MTILKNIQIIALICAIGFTYNPASAQSEKIENPIAVFAGLDKITADVTTFEIDINETHQFGTLLITPKVCYSRPITEKPIVSSFVQIRDQNAPQNDTQGYIFSGWMFAESPALNALEHPVYDIWLIECKKNNQTTPPSSPEQNS